VRHRTVHSRQYTVRGQQWQTIQQALDAATGLLGLLAELPGPACDAHTHRGRNLRFGVPRDHQIATARGNGQVIARHLHALPGRGAPVDRIAQVIGYGDSVPTLPDDPTNAINRRISITILPPLKPKGDLMMNDKK
jgi:hypothetical protein